MCVKTCSKRSDLKQEENRSNEIFSQQTFLTEFSSKIYRNRICKSDNHENQRNEPSEQEKNNQSFWRKFSFLFDKPKFEENLILSLETFDSPLVILTQLFPTPIRIRLSFVSGSLISMELTKENLLIQNEFEWIEQRHASSQTLRKCLRSAWFRHSNHRTQEQSARFGRRFDFV